MMKKITISTHSVRDTERFGQAIGAKLRGGELIELVSDVGGGKTTLVRGIAAGAGSKDVVSSPTFTLSKIYQAGALVLAHFDFYRLHEPGVVAIELIEHTDQPDTVVIVEWPELIDSILPDNRLRILIKGTGETDRELQIEYPSQLSHIMDGIT